MMKKEQKTFMDYFDDSVEYPHHVALDILPWGVLWEYISHTFLNGFINYVKPIKAFVLGRYHGWDVIEDEEGDQFLTVHIQDPPKSLNWVNFKGIKAQVFEKATEVGRLYHTKLGMFDDDVLILAKPEDENYRWDENHDVKSMYYFFWFDCDVSDCMIGRFKTNDKEEDVIKSFAEYIESLRDMGYKDEPERELPLHSFQGWISF